MPDSTLLGSVFVGRGRRFASAVLAAVFGAGVPPAVAQTPEAVREDVLALTGPGTDGRAVGTEGAAVARRYLVSELAAAGAVPLPGQDGLTLPFSFVSGVEQRGASLRAGGHKRFGSDQVRAFAFSETGEARGGLFFAGYGITAPENSGFDYDSYAGREVDEKVVVVLRYSPETEDGDLRAGLRRHASLRAKVAAARNAGAVGLIVVGGPRSENAGELAPDGFEIAAPGAQGILAVSITGDAAERLFAGSGVSLGAAQDALDTGDPNAAGGDLPGIATLTVDLARVRSTGANVVGVLPAADGSVAPPFVAVGAHYDHLGRGGSGSRNPHGPSDEIHPGADDNASGTAAVLAIARAASERPLARPLLVAFWSGEESGLLGSNDFVRTAVETDDLLAYLNLDMVGRMEDNRLQVQAMGSSSVWRGIVERINVGAGFDLATSDDPWLPTDSAAFHGAGIPTLNLFTGTHPDYHRPSDTADKLNYPDLARVAAFAEAAARRVADLEERPDFIEVARNEDASAPRTALRVYTGTIPEYAAEVEGLLLGGVMEGGPAEQAGLRKGDVIVEFGGQPILTIYDYMGALEGARIGEPIEVVFLRGGERHTVTLTPTARP